MAQTPIAEQTRLLYTKALEGVTSPFVTTLAGNVIEGAIGPLCDENGKVDGVIGIGLNVTEEAEARQRLGQREALTEQAQRMAHMGSSEWNLVGGGMHWSADFSVLLGIESRDGSSLEVAGQDMLEAYLSLVVEKDRETIRCGVTAAIEQNLSYLVEHRVCRDGTVRWFLVSGRVERDVKGKPLRFYGLVQDITKQEAAREEVRELNAELELRVAERTRRLEAAVEDLRASPAPRSRAIYNRLLMRLHGHRRFERANRQHDGLKPTELQTTLDGVGALARSIVTPVWRSRGSHRPERPPCGRAARREPSGGSIV